MTKVIKINLALHELYNTALELAQMQINGTYTRARTYRVNYTTVSLR